MLSDVTPETFAPAGAPCEVPLVAVAASAGGIVALGTLLGALPAGFGAALLVVVHLEPGRRSLLAEVLDRGAALRVAEAAAGELPRAGHVYVAPPDRHLVVGVDGRLELTGAAREHFSRPSADPLFASVAERCGAGAVAVVLSGMGADGSRGVEEVHRRGGTVIAQDAGTALHFDMPRAAIATGCVDHVVALSGIAPLLVSLISRTTTS